MHWLALLASGALSAEVEWVGEGRLLVDRKMLVDVSDGHAAPLLYPTRRVHSAGGQTELPMAISPSGQVALIDAQGGGVLLGLLDGVLVSHAPLPALLPGTSPSAAVYAGLWVDDRRLMVRQASPASGEAACALLDAASMSWSEPIDCPPSDFALAYRYIRGPRGWTAVLSGGEGSSAATLVRWDPDSGTRDVRTLEAAPEAMQHGGFRVFFTGTGDVRLMAPCGLAGEGCGEPGGGWWLYAWLPSGDLRFLRKDLPDDVVPSGVSDDFAWVERDMVCLGDPDGERRCAPLSGTSP